MTRNSCRIEIFQWRKPTRLGLCGGLSSVCLAVLLLAAPALAKDSPPNSVDIILGRMAGPTAPSVAEETDWSDVSLVRPIQVGEFDDEQDKDKVSVGRAVGLSLLLPGAGHWYIQRKGRAALFFGAEAAAWSALTYFAVVSNQREEDYRLYARSHAGIDPQGKDDEFYRTLTFYESRQQYNDEGRLLEPSRPYYPDTTVWDWQWDSPASMQQYRTMRNQSNEAQTRAKFSVGAALVNRLVAALDAWRSARSVNRQARMETAQWKVRFKGKLSVSDPTLMVYLTRRIN